jgi:putative Ca2+/H+ antiporter (TMEM165/GDT1 family)
VDDKPTTPKKLASGVEELRPGTTRLSSKSQELTEEELTALGADGDGVMDDPNRESPTGNTGTEGGISTKSKDRKEQEEKTGEKAEQVPQSPKEARPLPHGDQEKLKVDARPEPTETRKLGAQGLEKPSDLPDSLHDNPLPVPPSIGKDDPLDTTPPKTVPGSGSMGDPDSESGGIQPFHSLVLSFTMIIFSEIGDKTFLVAALMAMRHPRVVVFTAAFSALIAMTVLSAVLGHAVPTLIPERFTHFAAAALFLVFGVKLMREGLAMSPEDGVGEEMKEVEMELEEKEFAQRQKRRKSSISPYVLESGRARRSRSNSRLPAPARSPSSSPARSPSPSGSGVKNMVSGLNNLFSLLLSPAWVQTFVMTFLGEWGDRSQIATIAMAAGSDYWWVTAGAVIGHGCCTAIAVVGGRAIAGKVSMRVVTLGGAVAFLAFGIIYGLEAIYHE